MRRIRGFISHNNWTFVLASFSIVLFSSCSLNPIETVQPVVERIMYETVNELEQIQQQSVKGIWILDPSQQNIDQSTSYVNVKNLIWTNKPGTYRLGLSTNTECIIQLGDSEIVYHADQGNTNFKETAYGMYDSDTVINIPLDTVPIEFFISLRNRNDCIVYLVEENANEESLNIEFDTWHYAGSDQKRSMNEMSQEVWKHEKIPTHSKIKTKEDRYFTREAYNEWTYANGILLNSFIDLYRYSGNQQLRKFVENIGAFTVSNIPTLSFEYFEQEAIRTANYRMFRKAMLDDAGAPTLPYLELHKITGREDYLALSQKMVDYVINGQERLPDGTFCRPEPMPGTVWSDDLFMASSLILKFYELTLDTTLINDCILQVERMHYYLWDPKNQLHRHGYFSQSEEQSPVCWIRSNGWFIWSVSNLLMTLPEIHPSYPKIMEIYLKSIDGLVKYQGENGLWHQILTDENSFEETSGSSMFTLSIARGLTEGWLTEDYREYARRGWEGICTRIKGDKVFDICQGTGIGFDQDFYIKRKRFINDPRGLGALVTCAIEMDKLDKK
jgi:rhamnogalacturonyl hydrolase YesR